MMTEVRDADLAVIQHQIKELGNRMLEVSQEMRLLVVLNERQTVILERVTGLDQRLNSQDDRLREMEKHQPQLREARGWIVALISMACAALVSLVITNATAKTRVVGYGPPSAVYKAAPDEQTSEGK